MGSGRALLGVLQSEVLDRDVFHTLEAADAALSRYSAYYNYPAHGALEWHTLAGRYEGSASRTGASTTCPPSFTSRAG
jgi:hypothetical protein